jgi:hypothetical protein
MSFCVEVTILLEKKTKTSRLKKDFVNLGVFFLRISAKQKKPDRADLSAQR